MKRANNLVVLIASVFFFSGFSALVFKTLWFRTASIVLGSSIYSATAVLMAFMAGLGVGNLLVALKGHKVNDPLKLYIVIEIIIGISGTFVIWFLPAISPVVGMGLGHLTDHNALLHLSRFGTAFLIMLFPSICMGMTIPLLQKFLHHHEQNFSRSLGILYGFNTLGAVFGVLCAEFLFIQFFGLRQSGLLALMINLILVMVLIKAFSIKQPAILEEKNKIGLAQVLPLYKFLLPPFLTGFILLALEVIWFRYMLLALSGTSIIFSIMLAIVLVGIGIGGLIASLIKLDESRQNLLALWLPLISGATLSLSFYLYDVIYTYNFFAISQNLVVFIGAASVLMLPTCILSGIMYPLFGAVLFKRLEHTTGATGLLTFTNTIGAALGSAVATFVLLPYFGIEKALLILSLAYVITSLVVILSQPLSHPIYKPYLPVILSCFILLLFFPFGALKGAYQTFAEKRLPGENLILVKEGVNETLHYYQKDAFGKPTYFRVVTNNFSMSGNNFYANRYMKFYVYFPYVLNRNIKDVLLISYGVGNTASAITQLNSVERFDVVDISEDMLNLSSIIQDVTGYYPLKDPRTKVHVEDGRFYLQTTDRKYDLITGEPPPPKIAGIVNLYTKEYFDLMHKRLNEHGIVTYWLPVHNLYESDALAIIKAFCLVFEDCSLWNGVGLEFMLVGSKGGIKPITEENFNSAWQSEIAYELEKIGFENPSLFGTTYMADHHLLKTITENTLPVSDNFPHRLSPKIVGVSDFSQLYHELLDTNRRKEAFRDSQYIRQLLPDSIIQKTLADFKYENIITASSTQYYGERKLYYWEVLIDVLLNSELTIIAMQLLQTEPVESAIIEQIEADETHPFRKHPDYQLALVKQLLVRREFKKADEVMEQYTSLEELKKSKDNVNTQLYYVIKGLAGNVQQPLMDSLPRITYIGNAFAKWYPQWLEEYCQNVQTISCNENMTAQN